MENPNLPKEELSNDTQPDDAAVTQPNDTIPEVDAEAEPESGIAGRSIMPAYQPVEAPQTDLSVEGQRNGAVDHGEQSAIPDSAFGPMDTIEVNAEDMAVRVLCWHLTGSGVLGERSLVNIQDDTEALDILTQSQIPLPTTGEDGLHTISMGIKSAEGYITTRIQLTDKSIRILTLRALCFRLTRQDPEVAEAMRRYFAHADQQIKAAGNDSELTH